jgi:hypothetical protein
MPASYDCRRREPVNRPVTLAGKSPVLPLAIYRVGTQPTCELNGDRVTTSGPVQYYCLLRLYPYLTLVQKLITGILRISYSQSTNCQNLLNIPEKTEQDTLYYHVFIIFHLHSVCFT